MEVNRPMVMGELTQETELLVIGAGPGGYAAAFRAADLGMDVTMVDIDLRPGGVCLHRGCIPSKTFLFLAELLHDAGRAEAFGVRFAPPQIDLDQVRAWKRSVIDRLANGLVSLGQKRGVQLIRGRAAFESSGAVRLYESELSRITFRHAVLATGSRPTALPGVALRQNGRIMNSTGALELASIPETLLIIGGGYVGLELGTVYAALGSTVTLVESTDRLLPGVDADLVVPLQRRLTQTFNAIRLQTRVVSLTEEADRVTAVLEGADGSHSQHFDRALIAIGRRPNAKGLGLEHTDVKQDDDGFVMVDDRQRTTDTRIYAVGDLTGDPMLAHKATREGKIAAEVIAGHPSAFDARAIPAVVYTDPQIAWCGLTEEAARAQQRPVKIQRFPWKYSGRALTMDAPDGLTKIIVDPSSERILGMGITGRDTEGLIAEGVLAIEMGALAADLALSIHPHPTLSETEGEAAEIFLGSATHIIAGTQG
jgi:dihydrolipoamide dehydrogenase